MVFEKIRAIICDKFGLDESQVTLETSFRKGVRLFCKTGRSGLRSGHEMQFHLCPAGGFADERHDQGEYAVCLPGCD